MRAPDVTVRPDDGHAVLEVKDNGRGIDPKDHQRIFDLFRRAGTQDKPGQGIGLAHVRALVRRLGGTMSVSSEINVGSTFTITLPIKWNASNRNERVIGNTVRHDGGIENSNQTVPATDSVVEKA